MKAIAAMAENRVIGVDNDLPWNIPEDFQWFKDRTSGNVVVMGRRTFESIGHPLPNRETWVVSRSGWSAPGVRVFSAIESLPVVDDGREVWLCGGAELYRQLLPRCTELLLTRVFMQPEGDTLFPPFEDVFALEEILCKRKGFQIERWVRKP